jgi:hypothetical protein
MSSAQVLRRTEAKAFFGASDALLLYSLHARPFYSCLMPGSSVCPARAASKTEVLLRSAVPFLQQMKGHFCTG